MNMTWEALAGFSLLGFFTVLLPFIPVARTLKRTPLKAPPKEIALLPQLQCETFRHLVLRQFGHLLSVARTHGTIQGKTENGRPYIVLGTNNHLANEIPSEVRRLKDLIIAAGHLDIPGEFICEREIFAEGKINIGHNTMIRSALSPRDIAINTRARVTRWVRSDRRIDVAESAWVKGWANAGIEISLARRARFQHLSAPLISFGRHAETVLPAKEIIGRYTPPSSHDGDAKCVRTLSVPDLHVAKGNLIATETLAIGNECRVIGDLRAGNNLTIGQHSVIEGAIYSDGNIVIQEACRITGPIVAGGSILIHANTRIGTAEHPTTIVAPRIRIAEGCMAHGTVQATRHGDVFFEDSGKATD